jgi:PPP family 3-phenylpropionic acid transporter
MTAWHGANTRRPLNRLRRQYLHSFAAAACIGPFLSYVLADRGWTPAQIGYATAALTVSAVASAPVWGWIDDARPAGAARLSLGATAAAAVLLTMAVGVPQWWAGLCAVALLGAASGSLEALLTARTLQDPRTASGLGAARSLGSVGWIVGLVAGGLMLTLWDRPAFVFLLAGVAALTAPGPLQIEVGEATKRLPRPPLRPPIGAVLAVLSVTSPIPLSTAALVFFTAGWAHTDLGAGPLEAVGPLAVSAALELPAFLAVDRLARRVRPLWLCGAAFPPLAAAALLLGLFPSKSVLFAVQPLVALSFALWFVGQSRLLAEKIPAARLASGMTLLSTLGRGIAGPLAGVAGGAIAAAGGYSALFFTMAGLCVFGFLRVTVEAVIRRVR